jgi:phage N-6-adenine-methyltransferase
MGRQDWRTPPSVFDALSNHWGPFVLDAAADKHNAMCSNFLIADAGSPLCQEWATHTWINPPFGDIMPWVQKAANHIGRTVMLTPANTSSPWFREAIKHAMLALPDRRIQFWHPDEKPGSPDRDTVVWVFGGGAERVIEIPIPEHAKEVRRLWEETNGQQVLPIGTLL